MPSETSDCATAEAIAVGLEPLPVEVTQVVPDLRLHSPDDANAEEDGPHTETAHDDEEDTSGGVWSTTITPTEEIQDFDLRTKDRNHAVATDVEEQPQRRRPPHFSHSRIESLPPQRFSEFDVEVIEPSRHSLPPFVEAGRNNGRQPRRISALSSFSMEEEVDLDAQSRYHQEEGGHGMQDLSETQRAGLDFVDIALDGKRGFYGSAAMASAKSRTSLEIRSDFLSSDGTKGAPAMSRNGSGQDLGISASSSNSAIRLAFWKRGSTSSQGIKSDGEGRHSTEADDADVGTTVSVTTPQRRLSKPSISDHVESHDMTQSPSLSPESETSLKKVAGRYRGRISSPTSPSSSPRLERNPAVYAGGHVEMPASTGDTLRASVSGGMTMIVANDDGEVEVIDLNRDEYLPSQEVHPTKANRAGVEPQERELQSDHQEAYLEGNLELCTTGHHLDHSVDSLQTSTGEKLHRDGRPADPHPADGGESPEANTDVPPATALEASVTASASKGSRSAGPILEGAGSLETVPSPTTPSTSGPSSKPSGGRSAGPSALEAHISRTRQTTLPPKARNEDQRHLKDFELMMKESKLSEAKKAKEDEVRQRKKEEQQREAIRVWEGEILKDWRVARTTVRLRDIWWKGAPPALRGRAWQLAIGNAQMLPRNLCQTTKARVAGLKSSGQWPPMNLLLGDGEVQSDLLSMMDQDIDRTLPSLRLFQREGGVMYDDLKELLDCLLLIRADQAAELARDHSRNCQSSGSATSFASNGRGTNGSTKTSREVKPPPQLYVRGLSPLCATLLLNLTQAETLIAVLNLIASKAWLRSIYSMNSEHLKESEAFERVLDTFLADQMPKVYANMQARGVRPSSYARDWVRHLFVPLLPFDFVCRLWDNIFLEESDSLIFRVCLALVSLLSSRLYVPDAAELISILQGKNRAALAVWYRGLHFAPTSAKDSASAQVIASLPPPTSSGSITSPLSSTIEDPSGTSGHSASNSMSTVSSRAGEDYEDGNLPTSATSTIEAPPSWVPRDCLFTTYGINEENLFRALEEQVGIDGWFKETTLERLIGRELGG